MYRIFGSSLIIFVALLSEKLLMYGGKFSRYDFFVSRQSFPSTNHGGRGMRKPEKLVYLSEERVTVLRQGGGEAQERELPRALNLEGKL